MPDEEPFVVSYLAVVPELALARQRQPEVAAVAGVDGGREVSVGRLGELAFLVQKRDDAAPFGFDQVWGGERGQELRASYEQSVSLSPQKPVTGSASTRKRPGLFSSVPDLNWYASGALMVQR